MKNMKILRNATTFFANGANPGGILTAPAGMSEADAGQVRDYWNSNFQGENSGKVAVIGADMKFTAFAFKSADSQMVEQMRYSDEQICQPFGVPPFIVGIGSIPAGMKVDDMMGLYYQRALQKHIEAMENLLDEGLGISGRLAGTRSGAASPYGSQRRARCGGKLTNDGIAAPNEPPAVQPAAAGRWRYGVHAAADFPLDQVRLNKIAA